MGQTTRQSRVTGRVEMEIPVSGIESITDIGGGQIRVAYYVNRPNAAGAIERVTLPIAHIMPATAVPDAIGKSMMAIGRKVLASDDRITVGHC